MKADFLTVPLPVAETDEVSTPRAKAAPLVGGQLVFVAAIAVYAWFGLTTRDSPRFIAPGALLVTALFAWVVVSWRMLTRDIFHPYILFMFSALLFNAGQLLLELFGLNDAQSMIKLYPPKLLIPGIVLVALGLWAFHCGGLVVAYRSIAHVRRGNGPALTGGTLAAMRTVGAAIFAIAVIPFVLVMKDLVTLRMGAEYIAVYQQQATIGFENWREVLAEYLLPGVFLLMMASEGQRILLLIPITFVLARSVGWFAIGERSHGVMPLIAAAWLWHTRIRRIPAWILGVAAVFFLAIAFPVLSLIRNDPLNDPSAIHSVPDAFASLEAPLVGTIAEMGASFRTVVDTLQLVPNERPYGHGFGYLHALLNIFPNFVSIAHFPLEYGNAETWYVETIDPDYALSGGAWGFSFIAEAYLEFGWVGAPIALAVIGAGIAAFTLWGSRSAHPARAAAVAAWLVLALHFPRGIAEGYTRHLLWYALVPYFLVRLLERPRHDRAGIGGQRPGV